jgi:hypothetical protein
MMVDMKPVPQVAINTRDCVKQLAETCLRLEQSSLRLEKEARTLRYPTIGLIGLTGILAVLTAFLASGVRI